MPSLCVAAVQTNNNTYRMLRVIEADNNWAYSVWCTGERELYNMQVSGGYGRLTIDADNDT
jgi:hypothetical protein